jgi:hypothetical protein
MGIRLGQEITAGQTSYIQGMTARIHAYVLLILPLLLISAVCEAVAVRGLSTRLEEESLPQG